MTSEGFDIVEVCGPRREPQVPPVPREAREVFVDDTIGSWTHMFRSAATERAYREFYEREFGTRMRVAFYSLLMVLAVTCCVSYVAARRNCVTCSERWLVATSLIVFVAVFSSFVSRFVSLRISRFAQQAVVLVSAAVFCAQTLISVKHCPTWLPPSADIFWSGHLPDFAFPVALNVYFVAAFFHFGFVPWPRSAPFGLIALALQLTAMIIIAMKDRVWTTLLVILLSGHVIAIVSAVFVNFARRKQFAALIRLEQQLRLLKAERKSLRTLTHALFPKDVAARLLEERHGTTFASSPGKPIADSYSEASVVVVAFGGLEPGSMECPPGAQLGLLSQLFIAADHVAELHRAIKIKSIGPSILFVCGIPKNSSSAHTEDACKLASDLHRMFAAFVEQKSVPQLSMRVGIATGPVTAGVIGLFVPKYDVWGYTVNVANKLAQAAPLGSTVVTRDIAQLEKGHFKFKLMKHLTFVHGLGKILLFMLQQPEALPDAPAVLLRCEPEVFVMPTPPPPMTLHEYAARIRTRPHPSMSRFTLMFNTLRLNSEFSRHYTSLFLGRTRWIAFVTATIFLSYAIYLLISPNPETRRTVNFFVVQGINIAALYAVFVLTFIPPIRRRTHGFWFSVVGLTITCLGCQAQLWDTGQWVDPVVSGILLFIVWVHHSGIFFCIAVPLAVLLLVACLPMVIMFYFEGGTGVIALITLFLFSSAHYDHERQLRCSFATNKSFEQTVRNFEIEKERSTALLESVVPRPILERLRTATDPFLADVVPSATALVVRIVQFDELYKRTSPANIVAILNALFTQFDCMTKARGLEPLKTIADEYIVVGNMLKDMDGDHAPRVVGLAVEMISSLSEFNVHKNPTPIPIGLQIGIHTDEIQIGVIRMKSFVFDCWGGAIPCAEKLCAAAAPNTISVSASTRELVVGKFDLCPLTPLQIGRGYEIPQFGVVGNVKPLTDFRLDASDGPTRGSVESSVTYGLFTGPGDQVDQDWASANGFPHDNRDSFCDEPPIPLMEPVLMSFVPPPPPPPRSAVVSISAHPAPRRASKHSTGLIRVPPPPPAPPTAVPKLPFVLKSGKQPKQARYSGTPATRGIVAIQAFAPVRSFVSNTAVDPRDLHSLNASARSRTAPPSPAPPRATPPKPVDPFPAIPVDAFVEPLDLDPI